MQRELILRAKEGDHEAFAALAGEAFDRLYRTARLILRREDLAADAVQEALVSAWLHIRAVREPERFEGWLYKVLIHACYRQARRDRSRSLTEIHLEPLGSPPAVLDASGPTANRDQLERALKRLPAQQRAVLVVHYYLGMTESQAAAVLGIPIGTFKSRLSRATKAVRIAVEADLPVPTLKESVI